MLSVGAARVVQTWRGRCSGVLAVEVLVLSRHVARAGGAYGCSVWRQLRLPGLLSCLVLRAVPA